MLDHFPLESGPAFFLLPDVSSPKKSAWEFDLPPENESRNYEGIDRAGQIFTAQEIISTEVTFFSWSSK